MQLSDEEREEAKKIILHIADNWKNDYTTDKKEYFSIMFIADKIKNNEPIDDELLRHVLLVNKIFSFYGFRYE